MIHFTPFLLEKGISPIFKDCENGFDTAIAMTKPLIASSVVLHAKFKLVYKVSKKISSKNLRKSFNTTMDD